MKKFIYSSVNLIIGIALIMIFTENSFAFSKKSLSSDATQTDVITVSKTNITFGPAASTDTFSITSSVSWVVTSSQTWLTYTPGTGSNNGVVYVAASANTGTASRSGTITVTAASTVSNTSVTKTIQVTQSAQSPLPTSYLNVSRTSITLATYLACTDTFAITSNVIWTVTISGSSASGGVVTNPTWLTATPTSGSNNMTVNIAATANTTNLARYAYVIVSSGTISKSILVTQAAAPVPVSYLNVSRTSITLASYNACADTFAVSSNVNWTVAINGGTSSTTIPTWLAVTPTTGSNNMTVNIAAVANTASTSRTAYIVVSSGTLSKTITVTQPAAPASYLNVSRTSITLATYNACSDTFAISSNVSWTITFSGVTPAGSNSNSTWLTVTPTSGLNNAVINVAAVANTTTTSRTASIVVTSGTLSKTISVTQPAAPAPYLNVSRASITLASYNACADTFAITSNASWTITVSSTSAGTGTAPTWLTVTPTSGLNNSVINLAAVANTASLSRTVYVFVSSGTLSKVVSVTQPAAPAPYLIVSRTSITLASYNACADTFAITSNASWTIAVSTTTGTSNTIPTWLTITPTSGSNNGVINVNAIANTTNAIRTAYIVVTSGTLSKTISVTQPAAPAPYLIVSRTSITLASYNACADTFAITSNANWTIAVSTTTGTSNTIPTWLTVTPTSGSNNGVINVNAIANTTYTSRTAYIVVTSGTLSKVVSVTQPAAPAPYLIVSRTSITLASYNACADTFAITSNASWTIAVSTTTGTSSTIPTWLTVTPTSGSNNGVINVNAIANTTNAIRTAYIVVTSGTLSKVVSVTQPAAPAPYLNVSRASITLSSYNACADTFAITSNASWTITISGNTVSGGIVTNPTWLIASPTSGLNNMIINIAATANTTNAIRTAYIVVSSGTLSKSILVTQPAAPLPVSYLNVSRTSIALNSYNACADTFAITSNVQWTVSVVSNSAGSSTAPSWLTATPVSGSNNMIIQIAATANTSTSARTAYITVSSGTISKIITVKQIGITPNPGLAPLGDNVNNNINSYIEKTSDNITIFPNPTSSFVVIKPQQQFTNNDFVEIYSLDGRKVLTQMLNGSNAKIDMQSLMNGIYFVRITQNSQVVVKTINKN